MGDSHCLSPSNDDIRPELKCPLPASRLLFRTGCFLPRGYLLPCCYQNQSVPRKPRCSRSVNSRKPVLAWELNPGTPEKRSFARQGGCCGNSSLWSKRSQGFSSCHFGAPLPHRPHEGALGPGGCFRILFYFLSALRAY